MIKDLKFNFKYSEERTIVKSDDPSKSTSKKTNSNGNAELTTGPKVKLVISGECSEEILINNDKKHEDSETSTNKMNLEIETDIFEIFKAMAKSKTPKKDD